MIQLSEDRKLILLESIKTFFQEEHGEDISDFKARIFLDFIVRKAGVYIYNQAIADAHSLVTQKVEDLFTLEKRERN